VTLYFQFENTVELNILSEHVDRVVFASYRFVNRVDRVVCVNSCQIASIASSIASIASFRVKSRRWIASSITSLDRVVGSRRQSRQIASIASSVASSALLYRPYSFLNLPFSQFLSDRDDFYLFKIGRLNSSP
jgi:hypothetical protein